MNTDCTNVENVVTAAVPLGHSDHGSQFYRLVALSVLPTSIWTVSGVYTLGCDIDVSVVKLP